MNRITIVNNIFESEDSQEQPQKTPQDVKSQIIGQHEDAQFKQSDNGENVVIELPSGFKYTIPKSTLFFYQQAFSDNMEKYEMYETFLPTIDRLLSVPADTNQLDVKIRKLKEIRSAFSTVEEDSDINSIQYRIINSENISPDAAKNIFNGFSTGVTSALSPEELDLLNKMLNDYLLYYKYLIGVFKIYD